MVTTTNISAPVANASNIQVSSRVQEPKTNATNSATSNNSSSSVSISEEAKKLAASKDSSTKAESESKQMERLNVASAKTQQQLNMYTKTQGIPVKTNMAS